MNRRTFLAAAAMMPAIAYGKSPVESIPAWCRGPAGSWVGRLIVHPFLLYPGGPEWMYAHLVGLWRERRVWRNAERATEEARGLVRWLRPEFQNPAGQTAEQQPLELSPAEDEPAEDADAPASKPSKAKGKGKGTGAKGSKEKHPAWPDALDAQAKAVLAALRATGGTVSIEDISASFHGAKRERVGELLQTLVALGQARLAPDGRYST